MFLFCSHSCDDEQVRHPHPPTPLLGHPHLGIFGRAAKIVLPGVV